MFEFFGGCACGGAVVAIILLRWIAVGAVAQVAARLHGETTERLGELQDGGR